MSSSEEDFEDNCFKSMGNRSVNEITNEVVGSSINDLNNQISDVKEESDNKGNETKAECNKPTFRELGLDEVLCEACEKLNWKEPTEIQKEAIPSALAGKDIIALAQTGSGKTAAFALPILQTYIKNPQKYFALILTPTRELAFQISEQIEALGSAIGIKCAVIVGGISEMEQQISLAKNPQIIIATPGRLVDHLENTKGFSLKSLKYLVMDEADRILNMDFESEVDTILKNIPRKRHTFLFSATMTKKVHKLQRASLKDPVKIEVSTKYKTPDTLEQYFINVPIMKKDEFLVHLMNKFDGKSCMIFCATCDKTMKTAGMLRYLKFSAIPLNGEMSQDKRLGALTKFRERKRASLITTDVASRGLDIPHVDIVINYDIPMHSKDYIHRVGRTARAGRSGIAFTFVETKYDVEDLQKIDDLIGQQLTKYETDNKQVMKLEERVGEARKLAIQKLKELKRSKRKHEYQSKEVDDDTEASIGIRNRMAVKNTKDKNKFKKRKMF